MTGTIDNSELQSLMYCGFRAEMTTYVGNSYKVSSLFDDPHSSINSFNWYCQPHGSLCFTIDIRRSTSIVVLGIGIVLDSLALGRILLISLCATCAHILLETNFNRLCVV